MYQKDLRLFLTDIVENFYTSEKNFQTLSMKDISQPNSDKDSSLKHNGTNSQYRE